MKKVRKFVSEWLGDDSYFVFDEGDGDFSVYSVLFIQNWVGQTEEPNENAVWVDSFYMYSPDTSNVEMSWAELVAEGAEDPELLAPDNVPLSQKVLDLVINGRLNFVHRDDTVRYDHVEDAVYWFIHDFAPTCEDGQKLADTIRDHLL